MTKQELLKDETKKYIDSLKRSSIIDCRYTGRLALFIDLSNGGIGNIEVNKQFDNLSMSYSTLTKSVKTQERFFWEGTD